VIPSRRKSMFGLAMALNFVLLVACASQHSDDAARELGCAELRTGTFELHMLSRDSSYRVDGPVTLTSGIGTVSLVAVSGEGMREPIQTPVDSLKLEGDSVSFGFAPIQFRLRGKCEGKDLAEGQFSVPQPPFEPITGRWALQRKP
jgi:hypothetical protein